MTTQAPAPTPPDPRTLGLSRISVKVSVVVLGAMLAFALLATYVFTQRLEESYDKAGRAQLQSIAATWDDGFRVTSLDNPARLGRRIAALRELNEDNEALHKISVSWKVAGDRTLLVQSGHNHDEDGVKRDVTTTEPLLLTDTGDGTGAPIDDGGKPYTEVRASEKVHYAEIHQPIRRGGKLVAMLELHYDLATLDAALAEDKRTVAIGAVLAAITLAILVNLLLARTVLAPLGRLRSAAQRLGAGDRSIRLDWKRNDEIGMLAHDFDRMASELDAIHGHLEALALTDSLTGLLNHRAFQERLEQELRRAEREKYSIAMVALDVDFFKEINDQWGHAVGDEQLRLMAQVFRAHLRPHDISARVGGDEFCLAIVRSSAEEAMEVVDRLREHISSVKVGLGTQTMTISAGVAEFPKHSLSREELMHLADGALYWAKSSGRDRARIYSSENPFALSPEERTAQAARQGLMNTVHALANAVDAKDGYTSMHSRRVGRYAATLARKLGLAESEVEQVRMAGVLHDVGKIGIPDAILLKPARLDDSETEVMRKHSELGRDIIAGAGMDEVADLVLSLHEHYDGGGYPFGLTGDDIPLASRILHVADAFEAMTSSRVYRAGMPYGEALEELERVRGTQVDPTVADALLELVRDGELLLGVEHDEVVAPEREPTIDPKALELLTRGPLGEQA